MIFVSPLYLHAQQAYSRQQLINVSIPHKCRVGTQRRQNFQLILCVIISETIVVAYIRPAAFSTGCINVVRVRYFLTYGTHRPPPATSIPIYIARELWTPGLSPREVPASLLSGPMLPSLARLRTCPAAGPPQKRQDRFRCQLHLRGETYEPILHPLGASNDILSTTYVTQIVAEAVAVLRRVVDGGGKVRGDIDMVEVRQDVLL